METGPAKYIINRKTIDKSNISKYSNKLWEYQSAIEVEYSRPYSTGKIPREILNLVGTHSTDPGFVAEVTNCTMSGPYAITKTSDGYYILENSVRSRNLLARSLFSTAIWDIRHRDSSLETETIDTAVSLVGPWCRGYYHWFSEWLPRVEGAKHYESKTGTSLKYIIPRDPPKWMYDSLKAVGLSDYQMIEWNPRIVNVNTLIIPMISFISKSDATGYTTSPECFRWLRKQVINNTLSQPKNNAKRVYISREDTTERRVKNQSEVLSMLSSFGFEKYVLSDMSYKDQVQLFHNAEIVVGPHGAGLINTIYGADIKMIELFGRYVNSCYYRISESLGNKYGCLYYDSNGPDILVDVDQLQDLVSQFINND
jgi:hypothetical protein